VAGGGRHGGGVRVWRWAATAEEEADGDAREMRWKELRWEFFFFPSLF